ncbi:type VI immunity family protein [Acinetobacter sp. Ac_5812]|uniref:type VI immunity family protein n=1 Tax=Acinetobacter sp. Ac_5812 TaxID=1848937 RepID=UPI002090451E|nr:type VI immunity family protein [Acinetobacter sp. Ac_5812]
MHFKNQEDYKVWADQQEKGAIGGGIFTPQGPEDYVGAIPAIRAVLYFKEGYSDEMREAIVQCFDDYQKIAKSHLTWLWQDEPPKGEKATSAYKDTKPLTDILKSYSQMKAFNLLYASGKEKFATGAWECNISGKSKWQIENGTYQSTLTFSMPVEWVEENTKVFIELFINCARRLKASHGYAGYACIISQIRDDKNEPTEAYLSRKFWAMDIGNPFLDASYLLNGIKTVSWLTAINNEWFNKIREQEALNSELPMSWFIGYDYGIGIVIQAGNLPLSGSDEVDPLPAPYVLLNRILKPLRAERIQTLHRGNYDTEEIPLLKGYRAEAWMKRFDIKDDQKLEYFGKLQSEPKLNLKHAFLDRRIDWNS